MKTNLDFAKNLNLPEFIQFFGYFQQELRRKVTKIYKNATFTSDVFRLSLQIYKHWRRSAEHARHLLSKMYKNKS